MKIGFVSLGCSKNLVDTERMLYLLAEAGYEITPEAEEAEIIVLNTCGFIESAKSESIENILDLASLKSIGNLRALICTGCLAERYREEIMEEMPEVDALLGVGSLEKIVEAVEQVARGEKYTAFLDKEQSPLGGDRVLTTPEYTAYLKIAEGCDNRCTYCAIPLIRGRMRSRPIEDIVAEARDLERLGVKELNLIAQDTTRYGLDLYGEYRLAALVKAITEATDIPWIRLLYCYPDKITDELVDELKNNPRLVKYMDIPIQHISSSVLHRMNRHGDGDTIKEAIARLRAAVPDITLRTTAMVGFPGETEEDFEELCAFIKETRFDRFGGFTFSPEEGTEAALLPHQLDEEIKQARLDALMEIQLDISAEMQAKKVGEEILVLAEGYDVPAGIHYGRSAADAPDVDGKIYFSSPKRIAPGTFLRVKVTEALDYDLIGKAVFD
ncbi:MAG: 30S ribosomal protein S12 methylthiotransferase RimO [Ruminococcaceae bacterium]|nr:30S ribosomal protein S12 methylthiotransferase RimO [Oscillospiraceae bacterium]